jgi:hypothetical protein
MLASLTADTALRGLQTALLGSAGTFMATDALHGLATREIALKLGFPKWFPSVVGVYELLIAAGNWTGHTAVTQPMLACVMGGAAYTHVIAEGKPSGAGGAVLFWIFSVVVAVKGESAAPLLPTLGLHASLAAVGWGMGVVLNGAKADAPMSPVKRSKLQGIPSFPAASGDKKAS